MSKYEKLHELKEKMEKDENLPLKKVATRLVFGVGNTEAKILFIGEGPGYWEDQKGEPFVGNAGKLLDKLLAIAGLERKKVFITNVVHHRPPENRDPEPMEIEAYGKYLDEMIKIIDPEVIITLGRYSMGKFLPTAKISTSHGKLERVHWKGKEIAVVPMYHPAASLRNGSILTQEKADFEKLPEMIKSYKEEKKKDQEPKPEQEKFV